MRRYNTTNDVWVRDDEEGDVVFYSEAQSEIERLRAEVDRLTEFIRHIAKTNGKIHGDMVSVAKAEVITAHNDAIEAAAHLIECDGDAMGGKSGAATAIRTLKK